MDKLQFLYYEEVTMAGKREFISTRLINNLQSMANLSIETAWQRKNTIWEY